MLPPGYSYGFQGDIAFDTRIVVTDGGGEQRVQVREEPKWRWSALRKNFKGDGDVRGLRNFFLARRGALYGFQFFDPFDYSTASDDTSTPSGTDQIIGYGDGATTRFKLIKQYTDTGQPSITGRTFPRRVVPIETTSSGELSRAMGINENTALAPVATVNAVAVAATFLPMSAEVELAVAPALGEVVRWGGYFTVPARFASVTDQGLEATITGFESDEAPFEIESVPFDDPVPLVPGGSPYGYKEVTPAADIEMSGRDVAVWDATPTANINAFLDDLISYPTGGPHLWIINRSAFTITLIDSVGATVGTVAGGAVSRLFVKEDSSGLRTPILL